jgi:hypothetical protein
LRLSAAGGVAISSDTGQIYFSDSKNGITSLSDLIKSGGGGGTAVFG